MKPIVLIISGILLSFSLSAQTCNVVLDMNDSYGDGWNGASVTIKVNGVDDPGSPHTCSGYGSVDYISVSNGDLIEVHFTSGSYDSEITYTIEDESGQILFSDGPTPSTSNPVYGPSAFTCPGNSACSALSLEYCVLATTADNTGNTDSGVGNPSCGSYSGGDLWYKTIVPSSGDLRIETTAGTLSDVSMSLYTASGGCSGTLTEVNCDDDSGDGTMPLIISSGLTASSTVYIRVWDDNNDETGDFKIQVFDPEEMFCFGGNASDLGAGCAELTSDASSQSGTIWDANDRMDFSSDFSHDFTFKIGSDDNGADGMAFIMHNDPNGLETVGNNGEELGAGGIQNSLIVEIDVYINDKDRDDGITGVPCFGSAEIDHLDLWIGGVVNPDNDWDNCTTDPSERIVTKAVGLTDGGSNYNLENGLDHILRLSYISASQTFTAEILNEQGSASYGSISYSPCDPTTIFGTNTPLFGFSASTGAVSNQHCACLANEFNDVLPVEADKFKATCFEEEVYISWLTYTELNNDYFIIEKSKDGINYNQIEIVLGQGTSKVEHAYEVVDFNNKDELSYYRISQVDFSGKVSFLKTLQVSCVKHKDVFVFPNPANDFINISSSELINDLRILTLDNRLLLSVSDIQSTQIKVDVSGFGPGVYLIETDLEIGDRLTNRLIRR